MDQRQTAIDIFMAGVESVKPNNLIKRYVSINSTTLKIEDINFDFSVIKNIYVVGAGKASVLMAQAMELILGYRITAGHIITKYKHSVPLKFIEITEAGHPVPDENGIKGTNRILEIVNNAGKDDLVICLISGGGSALLADVPEGCTLDNVKEVNSILLKTGASISEMNCIRKHLSKVKGGQLARTAYPARVISLILSDVIGDLLDVIASGPTAPDPTTFSDAISIIKKYKIENEIPERILQVLWEGFDKKRQETLKESDEVLLHTNNLIIGTNLLALKTAKEKAQSLGYETQIITNKLDGDVVDVANYIVEISKKTKLEKIDRNICLLFAGEPTVNVTGNGMGGRNQHLAIITAQLIENLSNITFLSGGTDGTDGPTDATGAVVDSFTSQNARILDLNMEQYINNHDSYNFFKQEGGLIITGPTQTNVMDLMVVLIDHDVFDSSA
ncbi:MAG: glycerate kinase [Peptostreptococcaceae bacterium]|nr:glycerate kinase [Peptostreptococcaceae bacterium]